MVWFTKKPPVGIHIPDLIRASHEIGHYIAFCEAGARVTQCEIDLDGDDGFNLVDDPGDDQHFGYLVATMAGAAGERYWCDVYGQKLPAYCRDGTSWSGDRSIFKKHQRKIRRLDPVAYRLSQGKAIRLATAILRDNAKRFRSLTEQLAVDGELQL